MKSCINCEREIPSDSSFCLYCGSKQSADEFAETKACVTEEESHITAAEITQPLIQAETTPKAKKGVRVISIIRNSIIMAVSILLLVASFLPISNNDLEDFSEALGQGTLFDDADVSLGFNVFQYATLFFDSFKDSDDAADLYEELTEIIEDFKDYDERDFENLSSKEKSSLNKMYFIFLRMAVMQMDTPPVSLVCVLTFSIANIIVALALFVVAFLNLLTTFNIIRRGKSQLYKWTVGLLTASPAVLLAVHYAGNLCIGGTMSSMAIWCVICTLAVVVTSMVFRYIFSNRDTVRNIVTRSIALALSVVVFCLTFAPVFSVRFKSINSETELSRRVNIPYGADFFESLMVSEYEADNLDYVIEMTKQEKREFFNDWLDDFSYMTKREIESDYGAATNAEMLSMLLGAKLGVSATKLLSLAVIFFILTAVSALLILWQSLYFFVTGKHIRVIVLISKICAVIATAIVMIATIVLIVLINLYADTYITGTVYQASIGAGIIILVIFCIGAIFCPTSLTKKVKKERIVRDRQCIEEFEAQF